MSNTSFFRTVAFAVCTCAILPGATRAHAFLDHSNPAVGSVLNKSPATVEVWFTQELEPAFSGIEVTNIDGNQIDKKNCHCNDKDATQLIVSVPSLPAGTYKVSWHVVCTDTHKTHGDFKFEVKP